MDFLKEILGEELFAQVAEKINAHNGNEANKGNQIKIGNLGGGDYVSKAKHDALQAMFDNQGQELTAANGLIEGFRKSQKDNEAIQGQIAAHKEQVAQLQAQLIQTKIDSGLKIAFMEAGGTDIDFLIWKAKQGTTLELDDEGRIKGVDDLVSGLKTSAPTHFKKAGGVRVDENPLPGANTNTPGITQEQFDRMGYQSRLKLKQEQPEVYAQLTGKESN